MANFKLNFDVRDVIANFDEYEGAGWTPRYSYASNDITMKAITGPIVRSVTSANEYLRYLERWIFFVANLMNPALEVQDNSTGSIEINATDIIALFKVGTNTAFSGTYNKATTNITTATRTEEIITYRTFKKYYELRKDFMKAINESG